MKKIFDPEIEKCLKKVEEKIDLVYSPRYKEFRKYCEELFSYAIREESDMLFAKAYFYMMQYYASDNDCVNTISCAHEGIKYQLGVGEYELEARSYNVLGIYKNLMGDSVKAVEAYLKCLDLCTEHKLTYVQGMASYNLADLFQRNSCYERALHYYSMSDTLFGEVLKKDKDVYLLSNLSCLLCSEGHCFIALGYDGETATVTKRIREIYAQIADCGETRDNFGIHTFLAWSAYSRNEMDDCEKHIEFADQYFYQSDNYTDYMDDILYYVKLHIELGRIDRAVEVLDYFIGKCEADNASFYIYNQFLSKRIDCARKQENHEDYEKYTEKFLDAYTSRGLFNMDSILQAETSYKEAVRQKKAQEELSSQNKELLIKSNHDTLTRLPNRAYWHSYAEDILSRNIKSGRYVGVEILDIDYFKDVNDTYGHIEGDRYLVEVANALFYMTRQNKNIFAARYGGDEFVIVYNGMPNEEITEAMAKLGHTVNQIALPDNSPLGLPYVTISQGCCNCVPVGHNRLWDFLSVADVYLYKAKQSGKNAYFVDGWEKEE